MRICFICFIAVSGAGNSRMPKFINLSTYHLSTYLCGNVPVSDNQSSCVGNDRLMPPTYLSTQAGRLCPDRYTRRASVSAFRSSRLPLHFWVPCICHNCQRHSFPGWQNGQLLLDKHKFPNAWWGHKYHLQTLQHTWPVLCTYRRVLQNVL